MKKLLLILIAVFYSAIAFSQSAEKQTVIMAHTTVKNKNPRSVINVPKVWYSHSTCNLSVQFYSTENCTLFIYDSYGSVVEQFSVVSDGSEHVYAVPQLQEGDYTLEIATPNRAFEGELEI